MMKKKYNKRAKRNENNNELLKRSRRRSRVRARCEQSTTTTVTRITKTTTTTTRRSPCSFYEGEKGKTERAKMSCLGFESDSNFFLSQIPLLTEKSSRRARAFRKPTRVILF